VQKRLPRSAALAAILGLAVSLPAAAAEGPPRKPKPKVKGSAIERVREKLDRGLVALPIEGGKVYLGFRLLDTDPPDAAFDVFRRAGDGPPARVNPEPLRKTTDLVDAPPAGTEECAYVVLPAGASAEPWPAGAAAARPAASPRPYLSIPIEGKDGFQKIAIADLDGDGRLDFVIKRPEGNVDPWYKYWKRSEGTYRLEAFAAGGKRLWTRDLGPSIEQGIWYSPYLAYDLDGDGRAEVAVKTGEGDPRDPDGKVTSGPEWLSIWDGATGAERDRVPWPTRDGFTGEHAYNYYCRNQVAVAYLDGKTPCLLALRGTYNIMKAVAYEFSGGKLRELWRWDDSEGGKTYRGQGAHTTKTADLDGDGLDEVILGSSVLDDDGTALWSTGLGHPDHMYVGDIDPARPGLEIYYGIEPGRKRGAMCLVEAATGKEIWALDEPTQHVHSSGLCSDLDPSRPGLECYAGEQNFKEKRWLFDARGARLEAKDWGLAPRAAYWDADPYRELILGGRIRDFEGGEHGPRIEGSVVAVADILGDWREEIVTSLPGEMRIYTTAVPASDRRATLLRDPIYRSDLAHLSMGYTQVPMLSKCLAGNK
jgi:rhamnogalacturonan endolyase